MGGHPILEGLPRLTAVRKTRRAELSGIWSALNLGGPQRRFRTSVWSCSGVNFEWASVIGRRDGGRARIGAHWIIW